MAPLYDLTRRCLGYGFPPLGSAVHNFFFKAIPTVFEAELVPGIHARLDSRDVTQRVTYWQGNRFEYPTIQIIAKWITPSVTCFFDIGSNYGFFSYQMLSRFKHLTVHAFEPNPKTFALLEEIKTTNKLDRFNIHCMGLSDVKNSLFLHLSTTDSGNSTFGPHPDLTLMADTPTPVNAFDCWREEAGVRLPDTPSWVGKIDAEGYDLKVLNGMRKTLEARAFAGLAVEVCEFTLAFTGAKREDIFAFMESVGYQQIYSLEMFDKNTNAFFIPKV
ncbi:MAG: FkbM family methyltransferase [Chthoniobacteraceae bacterium]|jgi:FkbM family methyltransferase